MQECQDSVKAIDSIQAVLNILEDLSQDNQRLDDVQRAMLNLLEDLEAEKRNAQEANRMKSEFLANMSHELRTPLNAIIGFTTLMAHGKVGPVLTQQQEFLNDILTSSNDLLQLINGVLDLAKVEAGKTDFYPEPVNLSDLVSEVCNILRATAASKQIMVTWEIDARCAEVDLDPSKLKQALYNYLSNALKFTPDNGRVAIRAVPMGKNLFRIEIEDTGIGIRSEDIKSLFTNFRQLDSSVSKKYEGTGLGLALTKRIIEAQGGRVGVVSSHGIGSTFFLEMPRRPRLL